MRRPAFHITRFRESEAAAVDRGEQSNRPGDAGLNPAHVSPAKKDKRGDAVWFI